MHIDIDDQLNLDEVLEFARERHKGQLRADGTDYINHPIRVGRLVAQYKPSSNANILQAGCLLHDVLEDTYTSYRELCDRFGEVVASLVLELTSSGFMPRLVGKQTYLAHKMQYMSSYALVIKLADRLDNITDIRALRPEKIKKTFFDTIYMINYLERKRVLTTPQVNIITAIRNRLNEINKEYGFADSSFVADSDIDKD